MKYNPADMITLLPKLGEMLKAAMDQYAALKSSGGDLTPDALALGLQMKIATWEPMVRGRRLLDSESKAAMCRFLAGVGFNLAKE